METQALSVLLFIVGNAMIIALEGLVVFVQTTRLVLFEFITRFCAPRGDSSNRYPRRIRPAIDDDRVWAQSFAWMVKKCAAFPVSVSLKVAGQLYEQGFVDSQRPPVNGGVDAVKFAAVITPRQVYGDNQLQILLQVVPAE